LHEIDRQYSVLIRSFLIHSSVEISPSLGKRQLETVGEVESHLSRFRVECRDATDRKGWGKLYLVSQFSL